MKIVHVITRLLRAGSEENTILSCLHQASRGYEVFVVHGPSSDPTWREELEGKVHLVEAARLVHPINPILDLRAFQELSMLYRAIRPDVVHTHQSKAGILGRLAARAVGVPAIIHTVHIAPFMNVNGPKRSIYLTLERTCARFTHHIINVSQGMRDACIASGVGEEHQHSIIHSGMALQNYREANPPTDWRARIGGWSGDEKPKFVLMLAAFEPRKRHLGFIEAMAPSLAKREDVCVLLGGQGATLPSTREACERLGIGSKVKFLGHDPNPGELIALSDICVLTSEREGLPRVVVQYLAGGKPVVVSHLPGLDEIVRDNINGIITSADNLSETSNAIFALLDNPSELKRLAQGAQETPVDNWDADLMGARIEAVYQEVLARGEKAATSTAA